MSGRSHQHLEVCAGAALAGRFGGKHVVIREHLPGGGDIALAALPAGYDIFSTFAVDEGGGQTTVYFDRIKCSTTRGDIYKLQVP